ncbi:MAG: 50S ribosomal protein L5 [Candidatus Micrarchaeota archaeon]|nr:50S ribosomal protein L5 [Candidatus Micrarchaeota archaeon]
MSEKMKEILVDKVTVNIGVGSPGERLDYAKDLISRLTKSTPIETLAKKRNPVFKLRVGLPIGAKVTLRKKTAYEFIEKAFIANKRFLRAGNFDKHGNFSFGVKEYIDFPGAKYDPKIGMFGFDVCVTLKRKGKRVQERRLRSGIIGKKHRISKDEAIVFAKSVLKAKVEE